ncbi:MAG: hypothetical protein U1E37_10555 [Sphingomonadaceae bacterium]
MEMPHVEGSASDASEARARKMNEALGGTWSRSKGMCCCPAHPDRTPSLSITLGKRAILVHCFAGCTNEAVIRALARLGVRIADLFDGAGGPITNEPRVDTANRNAFRLWLESSILTGTPAERYLAGRGITISRYGSIRACRSDQRERCGSCQPLLRRYATTPASWQWGASSLILTHVGLPTSSNPNACSVVPAQAR